MENYICTICGVQFGAREGYPPRCIICEDERQWVRWEGQVWITLKDMKAAGYRNVIRAENPGEPGLYGIGTQPNFAIAQRALLVQTPHGNILWDCISYIDDETIQQVKALGGIHAIAISHPHFYGVMVEWSHAFGGVPIYIPDADKQWITRTDPVIRLFQGSRELAPGLTLIQCGGHFDGSTVIHWAAGGNGRGALLVGDTIQVVLDRRWVSFMYSYPNIVPLSASTVRHIVNTVRRYPFDRIYGGWWGRTVAQDGLKALERSAERYIQQIHG
ncbi:MAG: MBL fold metallo-hydrolase [Chloroflexi bacterium]|nr:MBL fold metallo-hydrolase [Chloroflexota bacterium]